MEIIKTGEGAAITYALKGRLDTASSPALDEEVSNNLAGVTALVFDLAELDFLSSAGLRVILKAQKTMNKQGTMVIKNVNDVVMEVFEITGFVDILTIE